jgi:hypothetical protein
LKWGKNFVQDRPNYIFEELEQAFCKRFQTMKNNKEVYMQLKNLQQKIGEHVEAYYEHLLKLANYLQVKATNVFLTTIFKAGLQPYLILATTSMVRNTFIKHKEVAIMCEESGLIITNYNALITHPKSKLVAQLVVTYIIIKQQFTCSNYGKTSHAKKTCHNRKR